MNLRPYQVDARTAVLRNFQSGRSTLVVLPTGCGKTVLAADLIAAHAPGRSMFIAHRDTLIYQAKETIEGHTGLDCGIEMNTQRVDPDFSNQSKVIISTVQTQITGKNGDCRMHKFDPKDFDLLIVDEAHHYASKGWKKLVEYYLDGNQKLKLLGITATPDRADEEALGQIFQEVAFDYEILDAIHDGWLVPVEQQTVKIEGLDFSKVEVTCGDLNGAQLAAVMEAEKPLQGLAGASIDIIGQRRAIVFTAGVKQAEMTANILNRHRPGMAEWVYADTPREDRRKLLKRFAAGEVQVVCNYGILTEGFDDPGVEVCIMGRPTKSRSLYAQMIGRTTRPLKGIVDGPPTAELRRAAIATSAKPYCLTVDFVGNSGRHKLITSADILGGKVSEEAIERAKKEAEEEGKPVRMDELLDKSEREIKEEAERRRQEEEARKSKVIADVRYLSQRVNPFDVFDLKVVKQRGWDMDRVLSPKQRAVLTKQGIDPDQYTYAEGKQLLDEIFGRFDQQLCGFKQASLIKKHARVLGRDPMDRSLTRVNRSEASAMLDIIAYQEGWKQK